jgi:hypothetical protein
MKPIGFIKYNGWTNYATWATFTHLTDENWIPAHGLACTGELQEHFTCEMGNFISGGGQNKLNEYLMTDYLNCAIDWVEWFTVLSALRSPVAYSDLTELDIATIEYFETIPGIWQSIVGNAKGGPDQALKDWVQDGILTWIKAPDARRYQNAPATILAKAYFSSVFGSIDWDSLTKALTEN